MMDYASPTAGDHLASFAAGDKTQAFRRAARHSSHVRLMRKATFGGAVALVLGIILFTAFDPFHRGVAGVSIDGASIDGTKVTMANPRLSGYRKDGRPFTITASAAVQDIKAPTLFELHELKAQLTMADQSVTSVTAATGLYNSTGETMNLTSAVRIVGGSGLDVHTQDAQVDFKANTVATDKPVSVVMREGTIDADAMHVVDGGRQVTFEGHVHSLMHPGEQAMAAGTEPASP